MRRLANIPLHSIFLLVVQLIQLSLSSCPPVFFRKDLDIRCTHPGTNAPSDCSGNLPAGSELRYRCRRFFRNYRSFHQEGVMACSEKGRWMGFHEFQDFQCEPECGRTSNSTFKTVSSYIEREHEREDEIFPWHVAIFRRFGTTNLNVYSCGGTLVNPGNKGYFVLTAAHCVTKNPLTTEPGPVDSFKIVLGATSTNFQENSPGYSQMFTPKHIVIEKEYNPHTFQSDIAMIELNGFVKISETVQPACFPNRAIANQQLRPGNVGQLPTIRSDKLAYQEVMKVPISEQGKCLQDCSREPTITEFCVLHNSETKLTSLDRGTGLVIPQITESGPLFYLQGVLTNVNGEADGCTNHDTFTSVTVFLDWVNKIHDELTEDQSSPIPPVRPTTPREPVTPRPHPNPFPSTTTMVPFVPPPPSYTDKPWRPLNKEIYGVGLNIHNYYRKLHRVPPLRINSKLSREAQEWAEYLLSENKWEFSVGKEYSENIFQYFGNISNFEVIQKAVDNWYNAIERYNWKFPEASTFSQIVWKDTSEVGIGVAFNGSKSIVVTNYWPKGNVYNLEEGEDRGKYFRENVFSAISPPQQVSLV